MFDARPPAPPPPARLPDHRHPQSDNQVSPCENLVNKPKMYINFHKNKPNHATLTLSTPMTGKAVKLAYSVRRH